MIIAEFKGQDYHGGFRTNQIYNLVEKNKLDWILLIEDSKNKERWRAYSTIEDFLKEWNIKEIL